MTHYCADCTYYAAGGRCRNHDVRKDTVGFLQPACPLFTEKTTQPQMETTPTTKVCKVCGRELTLDHFQISGFTKQPINTCKECMGERKKKTTKAAAVPPVPSDETPDRIPLEFYTDADLAAELHRRGYTGTLTKSNILTI